MPKPKVKYLTPIYLLTSHIIGRGVELEYIHSILQSSSPVLLLNGVAGIGKTTIAMQYVAKFANAYSHIAWVTINETLCNSFFSNKPLLQQLNIREVIKTLLLEEKNFEAFETILGTLSSLEKPLLIIDNANDYADLAMYQKYLLNPELAVLITSRASPSGWRSYSIQHLDPNLAATLFRSHYPYPISDEVLDTFLGRFDYLTLLIEMIAKSANQSNIPFNVLYDLSKQNLEIILQESKVNTGFHGIALDENPKRATVGAYIDFIFQDISYLSDEEKNILRVFCLTPPAKPLTRGMIKEAVKHLEIPYGQNILFQLVEKGWLIYDPEIERGGAYKMHPAIKEFSFKKLGVSIEFAAPLIRHAENILKGKIVYEKYSAIYKFEIICQWQEFIDHIRTLFFIPDLSGT